MNYCEVDENNKVIKVLSTTKQLEGFLEMPEGFEIQVGDDIRFFDNDFKRKEIVDCIAEGLIREPYDDEVILWKDGLYIVKINYDNKNYWYKENGEKVYFDLEDTPDDTMTDIEPPNEYSTWDETNQNWTTSLADYKIVKIEDSKDYIRDQLRGRIELPSSSGHWFKFSEDFQAEVPKVIEYIKAGKMVEGEFYYFDSATSEIEIYKDNWTQTELEAIEDAGIQHYAYWTNLRKKIVSQIQNATSQTEVDQILIDNNIG